LAMITKLKGGKRRFFTTLFRLYSVFFLTGAVPLGSLEIRLGHTSLFLYEDSGRFSFSGLNESQKRFEPFLADKDPRTSFLELNINGRIYRLGESSAFRFRIESNSISPTIVFDSETLRVYQEFTFIQTANSTEANGIRMTIRMINLQSRQIDAGVRVLLNTPNPGMRTGGISLFVNNQGIESETVIAGSIERYWISRSGQLSFMGSISAVSGKSPDYIHIGDWKQLSDVAWVSASGQRRTGRTSTLENPAVCYYFEPKPIPSRGELSYSVLLAVEDPAGFTSTQVLHFVPSLSMPSPPPRQESPKDENSKETDLILLAGMLKRLDQHLSGEIVIPDRELATMEKTITRIRGLYKISN
jgi:hypothetical protein